MSPPPANRIPGPPPEVFAAAAAAILVLLLGASLPLPAQSWSEHPGYRVAPLPAAPSRSAALTLLDPAATGLAFTNVIPESRHLTNQILLNGSGLAAGDVDGDGLPDVFVCGFDNENALFRNLGGWRFEDVGDAAGIRLPGLDCTGAVLADLDGDSDLDLVVNTLGQGTRLLANDGQGRFTPSDTVLNPSRGGMTIAVADVDGDGWLDLYLANYRTRALMDMPTTRMDVRTVNGQAVIASVNGRPATDPEFHRRFVVNAAGGIEENGEPDVLYLNRGGLRFEEVPWTGGRFLDAHGRPLAEPPMDWGLAAMFRDLNGDGHPDLYVCNDFQSPDRLWLNLGGGRFQAAPDLALRRTSLSSMAVDFADLNRDGHDDFLVLDMLSRDHGQRMRWVRETFPHQPVLGLAADRPQIEQNTLFLATGTNTWTEIAQLAGLEATEWSWSCAFLDVDLDGWEDLLVVNGMERAARDLDVAHQLKTARASRRLSEAEIFSARRAFPRLATPNLALRNQRDLTFRDASREWGFDLAAVSQALALADLDLDGDLDVLVGNLNQAVAVYRNEATAPRLAVRLKGAPPNTRGIGARIQVLGGPVPQSQEILAGGRYLSGDDPLRTFATGDARTVSVRVEWRDGSVSELAQVPAHALIEIDQRAARPRAPRALAPAPTTPALAFDDLSARLEHRHHEEPSDDFARQPLLPHKLSQPGPGVAWFDVDADGDDDLAVGTGRRGRLAVFRNLGQGRFEPWTNAALTAALSRDVTALVAYQPAPGRSQLLAALANYEDGAALGPGVLAWDPSATALAPALPADASSPGPLALADVDADGDLDLFVGGRVLPGRWPAAASSRVFRNENGRFTLDPSRTRAFAETGLVTAAVFSDLDADGDGDLVLACEWGPLRVFRQDPAGFTEITEQLGLGACTGWWQSVQAGDFDNDGRMDLVAGNWGRNTPYETARRAWPADAAEGAPWRIYHGDADGDGRHDVFEAYFDTGRRAYLPRHPLDTLALALPTLRDRFPTHAAFGEATLDRIVADARPRLAVLEARWLESAVFLNRGDRFEVRPLPPEAQFAPAFGLAVGDADGDGHLDVFLAQNFFAVRPHTPRYDGGAGLWLRGDGQGRFSPVPADTSGIQVPGEQRGAAVADFDGDGRLDLVVGQNGGQTRLFRNRGARPALSVRLQGPAANPGGVGARLRWLDAPHPIHELHAGGGWLSQDSLVRLLARPEGATRLRVFWPGKVIRDYDIAPTVEGVLLRFQDGQAAPPEN